MNINIDQILLKLFCLNLINPISEPPLVRQILQSLNDHHGSLLNVPLDSSVPFGLGSSVLDTELQLCFTRDEQRENTFSDFMIMIFLIQPRQLLALVARVLW